MRDTVYGSARQAAGLVAVVAAISASSPANAQQEQSATQIFIHAGSVEADINLLRRPMPIGNVSEWLGTADLPEDALKIAWESIDLRMTVEATDAIRDCRIVHGSSSEALNRIVCSLISRRAHFRHALSAEGKPVDADIGLSINFGQHPIFVPPAPPPPAGGYVYDPGLRLLHDPDWSRFATPGMPDGEIAVSMSIYPGYQGRPETRFCRASDGTPNGPLKAATCAALEAADIARVEGYRGYAPTIMMLVRWKKGRASYKLPSRPKVTPVAIENEAAALKIDFPPGAISQRAWAMVRFGSDGQVRCTINGSAGSDEADLLICATMAKLRYTSEIDLFGRKVSSTRYFRFDP